MSKLRRRTVLGAGAVAALPSRVFAQTTAAARPRLLQGVQSGDVGSDGVTLWSRADRPARMIVEYATSESFAGARRIEGPLALEPTDFTSRLRLAGLAAGTDDLLSHRLSRISSDASTTSDCGAGPLPYAADGRERPELRVVGRHRRPGLGHQSRDRRHDDLRGDAVAGAGFLRPLRRHDLCRRSAARPRRSCRMAASGRTSSTEAKSRVAETLADFRGNHLYNFLDANLRRFNAEVPMIALWDDHDVTRQLVLGTSGSTTIRAIGKRAWACSLKRAERAFREFMPLADGLDGTMRAVPEVSRSVPRLDLFRLDMRSFRDAERPEPSGVRRRRRRFSRHRADRSG